MEPMKNIKDAERVRDIICKKYASTDKRIDVGFEPVSESKRDVDKVKGYASIDFIVETDRKEELKEELIRLYDEDRDLVSEAGLFPILADYNYELRNDKGEFVDDPDHKVVRFVLELNKGDYEAMAYPLSETEEDAMRQMPTAEELYKAERREESRMGTLRRC